MGLASKDRQEDRDFTHLPVYEQSAADFYYELVPDYNNLPPVFCGLSAFDLESFSAGVNATWRLQKHVSLDASYMRYVMRGLDGVTSQSAYPSANIFRSDARIWF